MAQPTSKRLVTEAAQSTLTARVTTLEGSVVDTYAKVTTLPGYSTTFVEAVQDAVNGVIVAGTNITKTYDDANNTLTLSATGGAAATVTLATMPAGYIHSISYAQATSSASRAAAITLSQNGSSAGSTRTDIIVRIWGGTDTDADPTWMINGDFRDLVPAV